MKRFWQMVIRFRIVLAAVSILALLSNLWLRNTPPLASSPTESAEMPVETAIHLGDSIAEPGMIDPEVKDTPGFSDKGVSVGDYLIHSTIPASSRQNGNVVPINPNETVRDAMAAPTVQSRQVSSFAATRPFKLPQEGLLKSTSGEKGSKVGEQF